MSLFNFFSASAETLLHTDSKTRSQTIFVDDSYTVAADDNLKIKGNIGFKLQTDGGSPVDLTIDGDVSMTGKHAKMGGVVSTDAPNGEATVTLGVDSSLSVESSSFAIKSGAFGVVLQAGTSDVTNAGHILVTSQTADVSGVVINALDATFANSGDIHATAGGAGEAQSVYIAAQTAEIVNTGTIEAACASIGFGVIAQADVAGTFRNDGDISVTASLGYAVGVSGEFSSVVNNGHVTATFAAPGGPGVPGAPAVGYGVIGIAVGGTIVSGGISDTVVVENTGMVEAHGGAAAAIGVGLAGGASFHNSGDILATSDLIGGPMPVHAVGVELGLSPGAVMTNDGTITGEFAIASIDYATSGSGPATDDIVVNTASGHLNGAVALGDGGDSLTNAGTIKGDVDMGAGDDAFDSHAGKLAGMVLGGLGADIIVGSNRGEIIHGDDLDGSAGTGGGDVIIGGGGADQLTGGDGSDTFVYIALNDSTSAAHDVITDLQGGDVIDLNAIDAIAGGGDDAFHIVGGDGFTGSAGELVVSYDLGTGLTTISGDVNGDAVADLVIVANGDHSGFSNFVL